MKIRPSLLLRLLGAWLLLLAVPASGAAAPGGRAADFTRQLDRDVPGLLRTYHAPGTALALVENGAVAWAQGYGLADVAAGTPVTSDTVFQAASISKAVSAWGVMRLVERGALALDAPVEHYLTRWHIPPSAFDAGGVTIRRLLSHTSGLAAGLSTGYGGFELGQSLPTLEESLAGKTTATGGVRLVRSPGTGFEYSGANYLVLQLVIEEVTGLPFDTFMQQEVLAPLGMARSSYTWAPALQPATARAHDAWGRPLPHYVIPEAAAGGLYTTAPDLARWVAAHLPGPQGEPAGRGVLRPETVRQMLTPQPATAGAYLGDASSSWGLGHTLSVDGGRTTLAQHSGDNIGYKTWMVFQPDAGTGFVVLANSDRVNLTVELTRRWVVWAGVGETGIWRLYRQIDLVVKGVAGLIGGLALLSSWRLATQLRAGRRQVGWRAVAMSTRRKLVRVLLLGVLPTALAIGWWLLVYRLPLAGGFAVKYPYSAVLPLSVRFITASLLLWSLALLATALCPKTPSVAARPLSPRPAPGAPPPSERSELTTSASGGHLSGQQ